MRCPVRPICAACAARVGGVVAPLVRRRAPVRHRGRRSRSLAYLAFFPIARAGDLRCRPLPGSPRDRRLQWRRARQRRDLSLDDDRRDDRHSRLRRRARRACRGRRAQWARHSDRDAVHGRSRRRSATVGAIDAVHARPRGPARASDGGANLTVQLRAERYNPANGDPRVLGVQVDRVRVEPLTTSWWAGALGGWPWAVRFMLLAVAIALVVPRAVERRARAADARQPSPSPRSRCRRAGSSLPPLLLPGAVAIVALGGGVALARDGGIRRRALERARPTRRRAVRSSGR